MDLVNFKSIIWQDDSLGAKFDVIDISEDLLEEAKLKREELIENAVEADDKAMEDYLEGKEISVETRSVIDPLYQSEEIYGVVPSDSRKIYDVREVISRIIDGSDFDEVANKVDIHEDGGEEKQG